MNKRTATKASIKRASAKARKAAYRLDADTLKELGNIYQQAYDDLQAAILSYAGADGGLRLEVMQELLGQVDGKLEQLRVMRNRLLDASLLDSAEIGLAPFRDALPADSLVQVPHDAVKFVTHFVASDGLQLSDRLWRIDDVAREDIGRAIKSALVQGHSASRAAQDFLSRGQPVPAEVQTKLGTAAADKVARQAGAALMKDDGNPYYQARRLFRTEINRAHGEAYMMGGEQHEDFAGWRFMLSPNHPEPDICDMHARANVYGLGPGVYPTREACPWPAHPDTISFVEIVFIDEVTDEDREGKEDRLDWLRRQPGSVKRGVLGGKMKVGALHYGVLKKNEIATPWRVLKKRYEGRGIPIDKLKASLSTAKARRGFVPAGPPVSRSLLPKAHKKLTQHVLEVIDNVHGDGKLPQIPMKNTSSSKFHGVYRHYVFTGKPMEIMVNGKSAHRELTLVHELGHFLDHQGIRPGSFGSMTDPLFEGWAEAVKNSQAIKSLIALREGPMKIGDRIVSRSYVGYLLKTQEVWARSYAQYIARKSADPQLVAQLNAIIGDIESSQVSYWSQWKDDDFAPIEKAIDELFLKLGWVSER